VTVNQYLARLINQ